MVGVDPVPRPVSEWARLSIGLDTTTPHERRATTLQILERGLGSLDSAVDVARRVGEGHEGGFKL